MNSEIHTLRCKLVRLRAEDLEDVVKLRTSEKVRRFLGGPLDENQAKLRFDEMLERDGGTDHWAVRASRGDAFVGLVTLGKHQDGADTEVSYELLPEWWGQGYATEAVRAILDHALGGLHLPRVIAETQTANTASCRLLESCGMTLEKTLVRFGAEQAIYTTVSSE